jgi:hypothetical protein
MHPSGCLSGDLAEKWQVRDVVKQNSQSLWHEASGFWLLWLSWLLWLGSDLMAVIIISPLPASASPAAKNSKPAAQKSTQQQQALDVH